MFLPILCCQNNDNAKKKTLLHCLIQISLRNNLLTLTHQNEVSIWKKNINFKSFFILNNCQIAPKDEPAQPCNPSPCGANTICKERNGVGSCKCVPDYFGDPYVGCKPECIVNTDCAREKTCVNNKCKDPCPGLCGLNAICQTQNHKPSCSCINGFTGDPYSSCYEPPRERKIKTR